MHLRYLFLNHLEFADRFTELDSGPRVIDAFTQTGIGNRQGSGRRKQPCIAQQGHQYRKPVSLLPQQRILRHSGIGKDDPTVEQRCPSFSIGLVSIPAVSFR